VTDTPGSDSRPYSPGLEGVVAGETSIALVDGANGRLLYRGYPIGEIVQQGSYAQVAELLWTGEWREDATLGPSEVPGPVLSTLRSMPAGTNPMDALRTAISMWGAIDRPGWPPTVDQARALTRLAPSALAAFARLRQGLEPVEPDPSLGLAAGFLYQLRDERPDEASARALDAYFMVAAEHGFNASTFTARVITSTRSDVASAVVGAIGALKGPLHGGANEQAQRMLEEIGEVDRAESYVKDLFERKQRIMGFGHRVYKTEDPRATILRRLSRELGQAVGDTKWYDISERVEKVVMEEKGLYPNVDFYAGSVLHYLGLSTDLFTPMFAAGRTAGWTAHIREQYADNRLIRPESDYIGPTDQHYVPIEDRTEGSNEQEAAS